VAASRPCECGKYPSGVSRLLLPSASGNLPSYFSDDSLRRKNHQLAIERKRIQESVEFKLPTPWKCTQPVKSDQAWRKLSSHDKRSDFLQL